MFVRKTAIKKLFVLMIITFFCSFLCLYFALLLLPFDYKEKNLLDEISFSTEFFDRNNTLLRLTLSEDEKYRIKGSLEDLSPQFLQATLLYEDKYFYKHFGVNPFSLVRAFIESYILQTRTIGASTISMQVARLLFDIKSNTLEGKFLQIWRALQLEFYFEKDAILEAYTNLAPYGSNIEGIFAASRIYFQKNASDLLLSESLALALVPQNPSKRNPLYGEDFNKVRALFSEDWQKHYSNYTMANQPLNLHSSQDLPFSAPHFTTHLFSRNNELKQYTSLDSRAQEIVEKSITNFIQRSSLYGIDNAASLLIYAPSMEVRAYAGSADFYNKAIEGENDALTSRRSPGSTLKPFIYALALDQGLIHEGSILLDIPKSFSDYNPENFNNEYSGPLPASQALKASRNIPAINLAREIQSPDLYDFLKRAQVDLKEDKEHYGLSLVLGGAEISPLELASLYGLFLNQGLYRDIQFYKEAEQNNYESEYLLSKEASALALHLLKENYSLANFGKNIDLYIKTGTSNGYRDAFAVGVMGEYILLVWLGNFDNSANPYLIGTQTAVPLFYEIAQNLLQYLETFNLIDDRIENSNLKEIKICADTGDVNLSLCPEDLGMRQAKIYAIPAKTPIRESGILRKILVDTRTSLRVCQKNTENQEYVEEVIAEFWPADMQKFYKEAGIYKASPPPFDLESAKNPFCKPKEEKNTLPQILSPKEDIVYHIDKNNPTIPLSAFVNYDSAFAYWFVDDVFVGKSENNENLLYKASFDTKNDLIPSGKKILHIDVQDSFGRLTEATILLEFSE